MSKDDHSGGGLVERTMSREDTGRMVAQLYHELGNVDAAQPVQLAPTFVDQLADKMVEKMGGGAANGGSGGRKFLALNKADWVKLMISFLAAAVATLGLWFLAVRDGLHERPDKEEVTDHVDRSMKVHEERGMHPQIERRLDHIDVDVRTTRDSVIRQEQVLQNVRDEIQTLRPALRRPR